MTINAHRVDVLLAEQQKKRKDLADITGISKSNLSMMLNRGSATTRNVGRIARGLGVRVEDITQEATA